MVFTCVKDSKEDVAWLQRAGNAPRGHEGCLDNLAKGERENYSQATEGSEEAGEAREETEGGGIENGRGVKKHRMLFSRAKKHHALFFGVF